VDNLCFRGEQSGFFPDAMSSYDRMFSSSLTEDVRLLAEDIAMVSEKIEDPVICQKIEQYVMAPYEVQEIYRRDAGK
jgi:hypothetical protein